MPPDLIEFGMLAFQDNLRGRNDAVREAKMQQDRDDRSYRQGKSYLDRKEYDKAIDQFDRVIENKGSRADGAYYWRAYAQNKIGKRDEAIASLNELQKNYASSRWVEDAKALQV